MTPWVAEVTAKTGILLKHPKYPDGHQEPREGAEDTQAPGAATSGQQIPEAQQHISHLQRDFGSLGKQPGWGHRKTEAHLSPSSDSRLAGKPRHLRRPYRLQVQMDY